MDAQWGSSPNTDETTTGSPRRSFFANLAPVRRIEAVPLALVVDPDPAARRTAARILSPLAMVRAAPTLACARQVLREHAVAVMVLEIALEDGNGLDLLEELSRSRRRPRVLVLSGTKSVEDVSRALRLGATFSSKREPSHAIDARLQWLGEHARRLTRTMATLIDELSERHGLTPAERQTLHLFVPTGDRAALSSRLGIAETSVRSRIRGLCGKLGVTNVQCVYRLLLEQALHPTDP